MTNMNFQSNELFGIRRSTILIISIALAIGSFSAWKAVSGGSATAARISVSGTALAAGGDKSPSVVAGLQTEPHSSTVRSPAARTTSNFGSAILTKADAVVADRPTKPHLAVKTTLTPIEQIQVGDRVLAESPTGEEDTAFGSDIIPSEWRKLTLRAPKRDGTVAEVVLLRPLTWLNEQRSGRSRLPSGTFAARRTNARHLSDELGIDFGTTNALNGRDTSRNPARQAGPTVESQTVEDMVGGTVFISVPECGIDGNAQVLAIDACPAIPSGSGRVVTGTFLHQARSTITLTIAGQSEPIECTGNHPFWSEDRQTFVRADSLQPNEILRTATGLTTVESWTPDLNPTPVYNIEVHGAHVYHVGTSGVVVHNGTGLPILDNCPWRVAPKHWPPTIADGDLMHGAFEGWLKDRFPNTEFKFRVNPHEPGVDVDWINSPGSVNPGFIHAELKPFTSSGLASFQGQLGNWGLNDIALFTYDQFGNIFRFDSGLWP